ncbi:uncharacterized protein LOC135813316 [Sycon ciliatum]|uniref:uncharacterized protein LOC135813316 n=1 Tax=Sycon ciliatum TaxID=27933 RepID=UPI0031F633D8
MADEEENSPGPACRRLGIYSSKLRNALKSDEALTCLKTSDFPVTNDVVLELLTFKNASKFSFNDMLKWTGSLIGSSTKDIAVGTFASRVRSLQQRRARLLKDKASDQIAVLLAEPFILPSPSSGQSESGERDRESTSSTEVGTTTEPLAAEVFQVQREAKAQEELVGSLKEKMKVGQGKLRNVKKKLGRRDETIRSLEAKVASSVEADMVEDEYDEQDEQGSEDDMPMVDELKRKLVNTQHKVYYWQKRAGDLDTSRRELERELQEKSLLLSRADGRIKQLELEVDDLGSQLHEECSGSMITTFSGNAYLPEVVKCCMELLALNVGIWNVKSVIDCVLHNLVSKKVDRLPSVGTLSGMLVQLKSVSSQHAAEVLSQAENTTLHTDGTSKFGQKYGTYQIATENQVFSVGMVDMKNGTSEHILDKFKEVLSDLQDSCKGVGESCETGNKIVANIKNTMSDRCVVQRKFNELLHDYREKILPDVVASWETLSNEQQSSFSNMNNFFCGMHFIVGLADQSQIAMRKWEDMHFGDQPFGAHTLHGVYDTDGSRVFRLLRNAANAFQKHGNEQAGCMHAFRSYVTDMGGVVPLAEQRGNRSYVCYFNGAGVYYLHELMTTFLQDVQADPNQLLRAVKADLAIPELLSGARALGILSKLVIMPLWKALESKSISISDMSNVYSQLQKKFEYWTNDSADLLDGTARPFTDASVSLTDPVLTYLLQPSPSDTTTVEILQMLCTVYARYTSNLLSDHLPGGAFHKPDEATRVQTASVSNTNVVSERDFAQLDRLIREKLNSRTIALEGMIMFSNNKTAEWLTSKPAQEQAEILQMARQTAPAMQEAFRKRQKEIHEYCVQRLRDKAKEIAEKREKELKRKEALTKDVERYGLWTSRQEVDEKVALLSTIAAKKAALKAQLQFRKVVLNQKASGDLFAMSKGGKQHPVQTLISHLCELLNVSNTASSGAAAPGQEATPLDPTGHTSSSAHVAGSQHATPLEPTTYTTSPADVDSQRAASSEPAANTTTSADNVDCELEPTAKRLRVENE